jgi:general secretion pathway protein D
MKSLRRPPFFPLSMLALALAGCAAPEGGMVPAPLFTPPDLKTPGRGASLEEQALADRRMQVMTPPAVPGPERLSSVKAGTATSKTAETADLTLSFDSLSLPNFIQVVFGQVLKKNFSMDPTLIARTDLVTLRTGQPQTPSQVLETTRLLLKGYGVSVQDLGGDFFRIVPDNNQAGYLPEIRRGRAQPEVPLPMRPVFNLVELTAVRQSEVSNWLKAMFGQRLGVQEDASRNALLISGQPAEITAALEAIQVLDQPLMRGRGSRLITPASLSADDLAKRLIEILGAEGYAVGTGASPGLPISLVPVPASNALLIFAQDGAVLAHVVEWAAKLDQLDTGNRRSGNYFSYEVRYADAQALARTLQELLTGQSQTQSQQVAPQGATVVGSPRQPARIVVNPATNTLIVGTTNADDPAQLLSLMRSLDRPTKSVMIEVTVAEVKTGASDQLGIDWALAPQTFGRSTLIGGTSGGLSLQTGGLSLSLLNSVGTVRARLNALASDNKARILSAPKVMARNGESATIQVGQEVPIITSQQSTQGVTNTNTVLQTIQYRNTGVILKVKPIIFANRVELDVQQEVSSAATTTTGVNVSPTFSTRKIETKVSIRDGATVALGGLISRNDSKSNSGIPLLKDIPVAGQLFRSDTGTLDETELVILITPYVVDNDLVAEQVTQSLRGQLGAWAQSAQPRSPLLGKPADSQPAAPLFTDERPEARTPPPAPAASAVAPPAIAPVPERAAEPQPGGAVAPDMPPGGTPPALPGKAVTDANLLEELKRAEGGPTGSQPKTTPQVTNPPAVTKAKPGKASTRSTK